ncbi:MAG TPA: ATP-binding protein, partial [Streptosporangiaceae bacterium]|nr:ATP-binding protein [Streptosporangiaceae bacterium]
VSSVVHLAAHRARQADRSTGEAQELLALAQTVLGGADTPVAVLAHLTSGHGGRAELLERAGGRWVKVAASAGRPAGPEAGDGQPAPGPELRALARPDLVLVATGQTSLLTERLLHGYAAQAAAALDRDRLRTQAAQAEALAEGNRMRTALLAAVSHDLRTPLASIKASVSTLRQTDVTWTPDDEAELLATIERSSDRLDALIGNLLDMSRLTAGSLQPFLRPTAIDEVAPVALRGLDAGTRMELKVPDDLPLVRTDPGLLERVLANLFANALAYSPPGRDPELRARPSGGCVLLEIVDHGRGVPDELKTKMFEPFRRLDGRSGPGAARGGQPDPAIELATAGGVGLGLAVVRGFLDIMGGSVEAADTPHGGLTMRVRLPAATDASPGDFGSGPAGLAASGPAAAGWSPPARPDPVSPELREPGER